MDYEVRTGLPGAFVERMRESLGAEADAFFASYETPRAYGLRYNPLKIGRQQFGELVPFTLAPVPWAAEGCYYNEGERPGKHPFHEMGLYYIQEPSAMCAAQLADPKPGERVLDLCAAPGGKATQLAGKLAGEGLLVCNEPVQGRAKILSQNIERMGVKNAVVLNHTPQELELRFPAFFDKVIVDAPCSGEGMFHKEEVALTEWSPENVKRCAIRQREILASAAAMLRPGGVLVYSTCTFAPEENEEMVDWLLAQYPEFHPAEIDAEALGMSRGSIPGTARIYPHRQRGEGHFAARLQKDGALRMAESGVSRAAESGVPRVAESGVSRVAENGASRATESGTVRGTGTNGRQQAACEAKGGRRTKRDLRGGRPAQNGKGGAQIWQAYELFEKETLLEPPQGRREAFGEQLYLIPEEMPDLPGLKVLRPGLHLGTNKKNRFEPSHALALALQASQVQRSFDTQEPEKYLRGETLTCDVSLAGWTLVTYRGFPMGWGKASRGVMKNHYPKGLRVSW